MNLGRTALRGSALALCAAGALVIGVGSASASTLTPAPQVATVSSSHPAGYGDYYCERGPHHGDWRCRGDRGYFCDGSYYYPGEWYYYGDRYYFGDRRCHGGHWDYR